MKWRKNIRLKDYDYSTNGYYFVTICCSGRAKLCLKYKDIIEKHLSFLERNQGVKLDYYNFTSNHLHLILILSVDHDLSARSKATALPLHSGF